MVVASRLVFPGEALAADPSILASTNASPSIRSPLDNNEAIWSDIADSTLACMLETQTLLKALQISLGEH